MYKHRDLTIRPSVKSGTVSKYWDAPDSTNRCIIRGLIATSHRSRLFTDTTLVLQCTILTACSFCVAASIPTPIGVFRSLSMVEADGIKLLLRVEPKPILVCPHPQRSFGTAHPVQEACFRFPGRDAPLTPYRPAIGPLWMKTLADKQIDHRRSAASLFSGCSRSHLYFSVK
ncbi:hypothetical protein BD413DRAFT_167965 [Trametes elegans]|nr:hypothetical protein BD413DRAFT_167965 [Trametes elegans]